MRTLAAPDMEGRATATAGGRKARAFVAARFAELGLQPLAPGYLQPFAFDHTSIKAIVRRNRPVRMRFEDAANVVGLLPGRDPAAPLLLLTAHYDHDGIRNGVLYPGADDNASGVAAILEVARWLKQHPTRHGVLFVAFDAEELGLRGARAFVADPPVPLARVACIVNLDMVGRSAENVLVAAGAYHTPSLEPLLRGVAARSPLRLRLGHDRPAWRSGAVDDWTTASDHGPFHEAGVPFVYFGVEDHEDYHRPTDTADKIQPAFLHAAAEVVLDTVVALDAAPPAR